ncbi:MAG TPA: hypothetical protein ENO05_13085 [Bacteroides sp.]|nr:hypothetical protein [Bacteroides sp.]
MTRINVYKVPTVFSKFFVVFGILFSIIGIILLIKASMDGFDTQFPSGDWNSVIFIIQGILFIIMGAGYLAVRKYYIEWDDREIRFMLPDTKKPESILLEDITSVTIKLFEVVLQLKDGSRTLDLNSLQFEDLKKIKSKFEEIKNLK